MIPMNERQTQSRHDIHIPSRWSVVLQNWSLPVLMLLLIGLTGYSVATTWEGDSGWRYAVVALLSGAVAAGFAGFRRHETSGMMLGIVLGIATVWLITAYGTTHLDGSLWERVKALPAPFWNAMFRSEMSDANREISTEILMAMTIWMSAWISMWVLIRVNMATVALIPPISLILVNEHIAHRESAGMVATTVALALLIIIRSRQQARAERWRARRLLASDGILSRVLVFGLILSLIAASTMAMSPAAWSQTVLTPVVDQIAHRFGDFRSDAQHWLDDLLGTDFAPPRPGNYTSFSDGFSIGGPLNLTNQPEVLVHSGSSQAPYLWARSYDHYTGRGWTSTTAGIFAENTSESRRSPELLYKPNGEIALSPSLRTNRVSQTVQVTPLSGAPNVVYAPNNFLSANVETVVRMSWITVTDEPFTLSPETLNLLPPDAQVLGSLLLQSDLRGEESAWGPTATSEEMQSSIELEVDDLSKRGIEVRWVATSDGIVQTVFISGRLPVFDDVESVFLRQQGPNVNQSYRVTGLASTATEEQLESAGVAYPTWVTDRYLETGDSVTSRTSELTREIIGDETNPYRQAILIEAWLRANIAYDDQVAAPPGGADLVDYVLFDDRRGYCEHYSAAMVVMMRELGVPARVVVGYSPGEFDSEFGSFVYRQNNAHAWVEVYFPGYGWIPFEPTANRPLGEFDSEAGGSDPVTVPTEQQEDVSTPVPIATTEIQTPDPEHDNTDATPIPAQGEGNTQAPTILPPEDAGLSPWIRVALAIVAVTTGVAALISVAWNWGLRGLSPNAGLMRRVQRLAGWIGVRNSKTTTPRELARRFSNEVPAVAEPVRRITKAYELESFSAAGVREQATEDARAAWREMRRRLKEIWRSKRNERRR